MKLLLTSFKGKNNSSNVLVDSINCDKLYLTNSYKSSEKELMSEISKYDYIIMFGKKPKANSITIELYGHDSREKLKTNFPVDKIISIFKDNNINYILSNNAGNYLCNNIYYFGLKYVKENNLNTKILFTHIPSKITNELIEKFKMIFEN